MHAQFVQDSYISALIPEGRKPTERLYPLGAGLIIVLAMIIINPFAWPVQGDRAFLVYMSQVISRGESLYHATPFGYTPGAALLGGGWMALWNAISDLPSYVSIRILGVLCYASVGVALFRLLLTLGERSVLAWAGLLLFTGFAMPMSIACVNAEPKILIMLFSILGMTAVLKRRWFLSGLYGGLCFLCWQPAGLFALGFLLVLLLKDRAPKRNLPRLLIGGLVGPVILLTYIAATDSWEPAWNQLVLKHLSNEARVLGEKPFEIFLRVTPAFTTDILHFVLAAGGIVLFAFRNKMRRRWTTAGSGVLMCLLTILWLGFFALEFNGHFDYLIILPLVTIWAVACVSKMMQWIRLPQWVWLVGLALYSLGDIFVMKPGISLQQQETAIHDLVDRYPDHAIVSASASFVHVLLERQMPLKYIRYHYMETPVLDREGGCAALNAEIRALDTWLLVKWRADSSYFHVCAQDIFARACGTEPVQVMEEPASTIPIRRFTGWYRVFDVFECRSE